MKPFPFLYVAVTIGLLVASNLSFAQSSNAQLPASPLKFGAFTAQFKADGSFKMDGSFWPTFEGTWKTKGDEIELVSGGNLKGCDIAGRYRLQFNGTHITFALITDECQPRRMILDRSEWSPREETITIAARKFMHVAKAKPPARAAAHTPAGNWPSFRGVQAAGVSEKQNLPDKWDGKTGENILWKTAIPGLAHSSPVVWGQQVFVTSAVSTDAKATFRPGLYGDGDASADRSTQKWMLYALDKRSGKIQWERVVHQGTPLEKRHIKSTYANSTPATDGRIVVTWFGSQGVFAYDLKGNFLWKVELGRIDLGAYDIPTFEWGPASSPIIWNDLVILQCDTQADSFLLALDTDTGKVAWKTEREELPSWGTPTVAITKAGPELVTNASNFIRGYDPRTGKELWRLGKSSKITAPTPLFADELFIFASGRAPERPIFAVKAGARGDLTLAEGKTANDSVAWSKTGRGSYMPTPLIYQGVLYVLANNGLLDAYDLRTGEEVYRQRLPLVGNGFSASPVAADGKLYLSNEDGDILVITAGKNYAHVATNAMGELLMATPALSDGVMYVRSSQSLFAIGRKQ